MDTQIATYRRAIMQERLQRGMGVLFTIELMYLAGMAGMAVESWLVFLGAFLILMWLRRYPIFCIVMCILLTLYWTFGIWSLSYFDEGWSTRTITLSVFTLVVVGWIHWRGLGEINDIYGR